METHLTSIVEIVKIKEYWRRVEQAIQQCLVTFSCTETRESRVQHETHFLK